jgi:radical SAM superfamily enzyme YgiQ (UPF0313 family)
MRVLLIGPTALDASGKPIKQRRLHLPGLTLPMLAAVTPDDVELRLVNETVDPIPFGERWDLVGLTGMGSGISRAFQLAEKFRSKETKVVIGGIAATLGGPEISLAHADSVVLGEAEELWPVVVNDAAAGRLQPVYAMKRRPAIHELPLPRYDLMEPKKLGLWRPVQATRGCPFPCSFCSVTAYFEGSYRKAKVERVIRDVRAAKRSGSRFIAFIDDNIGVDWNYAGALFEALIPEKITWISQCSLHVADRPEMLALARRSGCRLLSFGIESTSPDSVASVGKRFNRPSRYSHAIETIRRFGIDVSTEMILGIDTDDPSVFQKTYNFLMENRISVPRIHIMTPIPGTPLWDELESEGRIIYRDFDRYSGGRVVFSPRGVDAQLLQQGYWRLYEELFSLGAIAHRVGKNSARLGAYMRAFVMGVNVHYRNHIRQRICPGIV